MCVESTIVRSPARSVDQAANLVNLARVEADRRLVEHQHRRIVNQRLRESDALAIALRKLAADSPRHIGQAADLEHVIERVLDLRARHAAQFRDEAQVAFDAHIGVERRGLRQVADLAARFERLGKNIEPVDQTVPAVAGMKPVMMRMVVVLPAPLGPRKPRIGPVFGLERNVFDRDKIAVDFG